MKLESKVEDITVRLRALAHKCDAEGEATVEAAIDIIESLRHSNRAVQWAFDQYREDVGTMLGTIHKTYER